MEGLALNCETDIIWLNNHLCCQELEAELVGWKKCMPSDPGFAVHSYHEIIILGITAFGIPMKNVVANWETLFEIGYGTMSSWILFKAILVSNMNEKLWRKNKHQFISINKRNVFNHVDINEYNCIQPQGFPRTEWVTAAAPNPPRKPRRPLPTGLLFPRKNLRSRCIRISTPEVKMLRRGMIILLRNNI